MSVVKHQERKKKVNPFLPFIGLALAFSIGLLAFGVSSFLKDFTMEQFPEVQSSVAEDEKGELYLQIALGVFVWFVGFVITMSFVSMGLNKNIVEDEYGIQMPVTNDPKAIEKYRKALSKNRKDKIKAAKRLQKKKEREASHRR